MNRLVNVLNRQWMRFRSLLVVASFVLAPYFGQQNESDNVTIQLRVVVRDDHGLPTIGLTRDQFRVIQNKKPLQISSFTTDEEPASVVFLIDISATARSQRMSNLPRVVAEFMRSANESNEYFVIAFGKQANILCDSGCSAASTERLIADLLRAERPK